STKAGGAGGPKRQASGANLLGAQASAGAGASGGGSGGSAIGGNPNAVIPMNGSRGAASLAHQQMISANAARAAVAGGAGGATAAPFQQGQQVAGAAATAGAAAGATTVGKASLYGGGMGAGRTIQQ
ncbi:unnamed protein product, partial [Sphacelaria rigidula]